MLHIQEFNHARKCPPSFLKMLLLTASSSSSFALNGTVLNTYHLTKKEVNGNSSLFYVSHEQLQDMPLIVLPYPLPPSQ